MKILFDGEVMNKLIISYSSLFANWVCLRGAYVVVLCDGDMM